ncbi:MAG: DUF4390 domain-containing protein [Granulosicoccus sp.]|nr:DUF4390 domain-containing protein [Granulosicoccus sp.]
MKADREKRRLALAILLVPLATLAVFLALVGLSTRSLFVNGAAEGAITLDDVSVQRDADQLYLSATVDIKLPQAIRDGLDSGVALDFILMLELRQPVRYWFDRSLVLFQHHYRLSYYELTRHYRVLAMQTRISRNYRSLSAALQGMGRLNRLPMALADSDRNALVEIDALLAAHGQLAAQLSFRLDSQSLPLPLQPLIASSWRLASKEYQWPVN